MTIYSLKALNMPLLNKKIRHFAFNNKHITDNLIFNSLRKLRKVMKLGKNAFDKTHE